MRVSLSWLKKYVNLGAVTPEELKRALPMIGLDVESLEVKGLPPLPEWGLRAERAHNNLKENFPSFAVAVLLLALTGGFTHGTQIAAAVFGGARVVHMPAYIQGRVWPRVISWVLGLGATLYLLGMAVNGLVKF